MQTLTRILSLAAILTSLTGCAALRSDFETPDVSISSFTVVPGNTPMPTFEIGLRVVNPNASALKLRGVSYAVSLAGREVVTGAGTNLPVIEGYSEGTFTLTAAANFFDGFKILTDLMKQPRDRIPYEVSTKLDVGALIPAIRVTDAGEISLSQSR